MTAHHHPSFAAPVERAPSSPTRTLLSTHPHLHSPFVNRSQGWLADCWLLAAGWCCWLVVDAWWLMPGGCWLSSGGWWLPIRDPCHSCVRRVSLRRPPLWTLGSTARTSTAAASKNKNSKAQAHGQLGWCGTVHVTAAFLMPLASRHARPVWAFAGHRYVRRVKRNQLDRRSHRIERLATPTRQATR